jgi:hypothetical protein
VDHNSFAPLRFCEKKKEKKNMARKDAKPQRPPAGRQVRIRRGGQEVDHNFFASLRLCESK